MTREEILQARTTFANMGIDDKTLNQKIETLSLGEKTRVKLCGMLINNYDLLILDEPTNHLDLASQEQLEHTLSSFTDTLLIISHDVYFLNRLCDKLLVIDDQRIQRFEVGLEEYENRKSVPSQESNREEQLLVVETEISAVLGELSMLTPQSDRYKVLDEQFLQLSKRKRVLMY